jgi:hypothetical protein
VRLRVAGHRALDHGDALVAVFAAQRLWRCPLERSQDSMIARGLPIALRPIAMFSPARR